MAAWTSALRHSPHQPRDSASLLLVGDGPLLAFHRPGLLEFPDTCLYHPFKKKP